MTLADDCVVLDAVSRIGPGELWVTAQTVVGADFPDRHQAALERISWDPCGIRPDRASPRSAKPPDPRVNPGGFGERWDQTS